MSSFKEQVHRYYYEMILHKVKVLQQQQDDLMESLKHETKSTAGDKYETSRAMLHMEQENIAVQLSVLMQQKATLEGISAIEKNVKDLIQFGSLVKTNKGYIFIAAALGKALIDDRNVFSISSESPLGKLLTGKTLHDKIQVQSVIYIVEAVY